MNSAKSLQNVENKLENINENAFFKLGFFGSSSFVLPILENILENENQTLVRIALKQLQILQRKNQELEKSELGKNDQNEQVLQQEIKPNWWKNEELLEILEFVLKIEKEFETSFETEMKPESWKPKKSQIDVNLENSSNNSNGENFDLENDSTQNNSTQNSQSNSIQDLTNKTQGLANDLDNNLTDNLANNSTDFQTKKLQNSIKVELEKLQKLGKIPSIFQNNPQSVILITNFLKKIKLNLVITQPDRQNGKKIISNPISEFAKTKKLNLKTPLKINKEIEDIKQNYVLDCAIVASFGQILNSKVLNFPNFGILNWHPSLLPKYRGATPIQTALLDNQKISGLSWIEMTKGMDSGPIWLQIPTLIDSCDTFETFADKMGKLGSETWTLPLVANLLQKIMTTIDENE